MKKIEFILLHSSLNFLTLFCLSASRLCIISNLKQFIALAFLRRRDLIRNSSHINMRAKYKYDAAHLLPYRQMKIFRVEEENVIFFSITKIC